MTGVPLDTILHHLRHVIAAGPLAELSDRQLVERFTSRRDEVAFALLVRRHGPLVLSVCRRVLGDAHDAEDAFQATFLVLARKAAAIRKHESVGSWLHGVAYRVAVKARAAAGRRRTRERQAGPMRESEPSVESVWQELAPVLDEEVQRLPDKYRVPLVLCYWEGKTHKAAAEELGCPVGTLSWRLAQARDLLRGRLARRGVTLSAALLAAALSQHVTAAVVPATLLMSTIQVGLSFAAASAPAVVATPAVLLAEGALQTMTVSKLKLAALLLLTAGLAGGAGLLTHPALADKPVATRPATPTAPPARPAAPAPSPAEPTRPEEGDDTPDLYRDVTAQSGVAFTYRNGEEANQYTTLEGLGGGVAVLDYDGDGLLDLFITGGGHFDGPDKKQIKGHPCKLFKNLGGCRFKDVTQEAGLAGPWFYSHGCAVIDYDRDGWPDLLVTGYGRLALFHNEPDGKGGRRFVDVTKKAGLPDGLWTTSAAWADFDGDGFPDLYLCQYVDWSFQNHPACTSDGKTPDLCPPKHFAGLPHKLYRNNGDGTFTDVSQAAGLRGGGPDASKGRGVIVVDVDQDGKPDIYVANDTTDHFLYRNRSTSGTIRFDEIGMQAGVARDDRGVPNGSAGVAVGDYDGCGRPSLFVTSYENELHALYHNEGKASGVTFRFSSQKAGIATIGQRSVGFGVSFLDVDNDGDEDLVIIHGHVLRHPAKGPRGQRPVLLHNEGNGRFRDVTVQGGVYFRSEHVGRGLVVADLDNDGRPDLVIVHLNEPVVILRNQATVGRHWLGVELVGKDRRDATGAWVLVEAGGRRLTRFLTGGGSYLSSADRRLLFGLGDTDHIDRLTVFWPSGREQQWDGKLLKIDRYWRLVEGQDAPQARK